MSAHYVYRCYDADGDLIYIGCTSNVKRRMSAHRSGRARASRWLSACMARYEVEGPFADKAAGIEAERQAIQVEQPLFNYQERGGVDFAAWMTRSDVAAYLIERGHVALAAETVCRCWGEVREAGHFDPSMCAAHVAASEAGLTDLTPMPSDFFALARTG